MYGAFIVGAKSMYVCFRFQLWSRLAWSFYFIKIIYIEIAFFTAFSTISKHIWQYFAHNSQKKCLGSGKNLGRVGKPATRIWAASWQNLQNDIVCSEDSNQPDWSESSLSAWRKLGFLATHWAHDMTLIRLGGCPCWSKSSLGAHVTLLVLPCRGSCKDERNCL